MIIIKKIKLIKVPTLIVVDGNNLAYRSICAMGYKVDNPAIFGFYGSIRRLIEEYPIENFRIIVIWDRGGSEFRQKIYSAYKARRGRINREIMVEVIKIQKFLELLKVKQAVITGIEGDDIIGFVAKNFLDIYPEAKALIVSADKDLYQLLSSRVDIWRLRDQKQGGPDRYTKTRFQNEYQLNPIDWPKVKALCGDVSDDIPGIKGIGDVTALRLVKREKTLDGLMNNKELLFTNKRTHILYKNPEVRSILKRNFALVTIRTRLKQFIFLGHRALLRSLISDMKHFDERYNHPSIEEVTAALSRFNIKKYSSEMTMEIFGLNNTMLFLEGEKDGSAFYRA